MVSKCSRANRGLSGWSSSDVNPISSHWTLKIYLILKGVKCSQANKGVNARGKSHLHTQVEILSILRHLKPTQSCVSDGSDRIGFKLLGKKIRKRNFKNQSDTNPKNFQNQHFNSEIRIFRFFEIFGFFRNQIYSEFLELRNFWNFKKI